MNLIKCNFSIVEGIKILKSIFGLEDSVYELEGIFFM